MYLATLVKFLSISNSNFRASSMLQASEMQKRALKVSYKFKSKQKIIKYFIIYTVSVENGYTM